MFTGNWNIKCEMCQIACVLSYMCACSVFFCDCVYDCFFFVWLWLFLCVWFSCSMSFIQSHAFSSLVLRKIFNDEKYLTKPLEINTCTCMTVCISIWCGKCVCVCVCVCVHNMRLIVWACKVYDGRNRLRSQWITNFIAKRILLKYIHDCTNFIFIFKERPPKNTKWYLSNERKTLVYILKLWSILSHIFLVAGINLTRDLYTIINYIILRGIWMIV